MPSNRGIVNLVIEFSFPLIDPRLRSVVDTEEDKEGKGTFLGWMREAGTLLSAWVRELRQRFTRRTSELPPLPNGLQLLPTDKDEHVVVERRRWLLRNFFSNPAFIIGSFCSSSCAA